MVSGCNGTLVFMAGDNIYDIGPETPETKQWDLHNTEINLKSVLIMKIF